MSITIVYVAIVGQNYGGVEQKIISQFDALKQYRSNVFLYLLTSFPPRGAFAEQIKKRSCDTANGEIHFAHQCA